MKKFLGFIPFAAISAIIPYAFTYGINYPQAIIATIVGALCAHQYFIMWKEQPNYTKQFQAQIDEIRKENKELKEKYGKMSLETNKKANVSKVFKF